MEDVIEILEHRRIEPDVALPWRVGQSQDNGYDMDAVVRYDMGVCSHRPSLATGL
ncbi:hypothetical protein GCM10010233_17750 [Streptomyces pseudogriseolus]|nr:hypothetical protein GCM10010233_17750 [Streptomyces gancidicus]